MSRSDAGAHAPTRFDDWVAHEFRRTGGFTVLVILIAIGEVNVTPLRSTYFHIVGDDIDWARISRLLADSGAKWDGVLFASRTDHVHGGPVSDVVARFELQELTEMLEQDRMILNANHFFDRWGRRLKIEEMTAQ